VNTILVVLVVKLMNQLVVLSFMSDVDYQICGKFYDDHARKNSAHVHVSTQSYACFVPVWSAVQTANLSLGPAIGERVNVKILSCVEYQS
jgi:hypothetical protein